MGSRSNLTERLVSTVRQHNGERWIEQGEEFSADKREAEKQLRYRWAKRNETAETKPPGHVPPRPLPPRPAPGGRYARRDMRAEGDE